MAKQLKTIAGYDCRNEWVLSFWRKVVSDGADWTSTGRLFQIGGLAAANERSPTVTSRDGRMSRRLEVDECMTLFAGSAFHSVAAGVMVVHSAFCLWWPWLLTFDLDIQNRLSDGPNTRLPCEFGAHPFSASRDIWLTKTKNSQAALKQNLRMVNRWRHI